MAHVLAGAAWAFAVVLLVDVLHVPLGLLGVTGVLFACGDLGQKLAVALWPLAPPLFVVALIAELHTRKGARWWMALGVVAMTVAMSFVLYIILVGYQPFAGHVPFIVLHVGLAAALALGWGHAYTRLSHARAQMIAGTSGVVLAAAVSVANYTLYAERYPSLHLTGLGATVLLLAVGLANLLALTPERASKRLAVGSVIPTVVVVLLASGLGPDGTRAHHRAMASGSLIALSGFAPRLTEEPIRIPDFEGPCEEPPEPMDRDAALALFAERAHMPSLPEGFRLGDYNILLILIDTVRFDDTSLASGGPSTTPRIKAFGDGGAFQFDRAYAPSSVTFQTMASLLAMTMPSLTNTFVNVMRPWIGELQEGGDVAIGALSSAGYETFSVLHLGTRICHGCMRNIEDRTEGAAMRDPNHDEKLAATAIERIDAHADDRFFGWVFFFNPHDPYMNREGESSPKRSWYRDEIAYADSQVGRVLAHLETTGLLDETVVIIASDHGEEFGEHGALHHAHNVYVESLHVPLLVRIPNVEGTHIASPTSINYVLPWLMTHGPAPMREAAERVIVSDIAPLMKATGGGVPAELLGLLAMQATLIYDEHKVNYNYRTETLSMYDLAADPTERTKLAADAPVRDELTRRWDAYRAFRACRHRYAFDEKSDLYAAEAP